MKMLIVDMPVNTIFILNGNKCKKISNRTILLVEFNRRFYFGKNETGLITK